MPDAGHTPEHKEQSDSNPTPPPTEAPVAPSVDAAAKGPGSHDHDHAHGHDDHAHGHDDHAHGHDDHGHPVATDIIPEKSWQDGLLCAIAFLVLAGYLTFGYVMMNAPLASASAESHETHHE